MKIAQDFIIDAIIQFDKDRECPEVRFNNLDRYRKESGLNEVDFKKYFQEGLKNIKKECLVQGLVEYSDRHLNEYRDLVFPYLASGEVKYDYEEILNKCPEVYDRCLNWVTSQMAYFYVIQTSKILAGVNRWRENDEHEEVEETIYYSYGNVLNDINLFEKDKPDDRLKTNLTEGQLSGLLEALIKDSYIAPDTDLNSFMWAFGGETCNEDFHPIRWIKKCCRVPKTISKKSLLDLLALLGVEYKSIIDKKLLSRLFADSKGNALKYTSSNFQKWKPNSGDFESEYHQELMRLINGIRG